MPFDIRPTREARWVAGVCVESRLRRFAFRVAL